MTHIHSILALIMLLSVLFAQPSLASEEKSQQTSRQSRSSMSTTESVPMQYYSPPGCLQSY